MKKYIYVYKGCREECKSDIVVQELTGEKSICIFTYICTRVPDKEFILDWWSQYDLNFMKIPPQHVID